MKTFRTLLTLTAAAVLAVPTLRAQENKPAGERPARQAGAEGRPQLDPAARLKELTEKLTLTGEQQEKVKAIYAKNVDKLKAMREDKAATPESRREKFVEMRKAETEEINAILTPEQQAKMKEMQSELRQRAGAARGQRPAPKPEQK